MLNATVGVCDDRGISVASLKCTVESQKMLGSMLPFTEINAYVLQDFVFQPVSSQLTFLFLAPFLHSAPFAALQRTPFEAA